MRGRDKPSRHRTRSRRPDRHDPSDQYRGGPENWPAIRGLCRVEAMSIAAAAARGTPCLRVFADTLFVDDGSRRGDEVRTAMLRLDFDYGGRRVRAVDPRPSNLRDPAAEAQACRVLEGFGGGELAQQI